MLLLTHSDKPPVVRGACLGFRDGRFVYQYSCARCRGQFLEDCPEVSVPALCHGCYCRKDHSAVKDIGRRKGRRQFRKMPEGP